MKFQLVSCYYFCIVVFVDTNIAYSNHSDLKKKQQIKQIQQDNGLPSSNINNQEKLEKIFTVLQSNTEELEQEDINYIQNIQEKFTQWLNSSTTTNNSLDNIIKTPREILNLSRELFQKVGTLYCRSSPIQGAEDTQHKSSIILSSTTSILGNVIAKCIQNHKMELATRILQLYVGLLECVIDSKTIKDDKILKVFDEPLINFAIFPKMYHPKIWNKDMETFELYQLMSMLSKILLQQKEQQQRDKYNTNPSHQSLLLSKMEDEEWMLCQKVLPSSFLIGEKWNMFYELISYNLGCLQYYVGDFVRCRSSYEQVIYNNISKSIEADIESVLSKYNEDLVEALPSSLLVFTVASQYTSELNNLLQSADDIVMSNTSNNKKGDTELKIQVLGLGQSFPGTFKKVQMLHEKVSTLPSNQIVLFVDAYDVLVFPTIRNLISLFKSGNMTKDGIFKPIIFGVERSIVPYPDPGVGLLYEDEEENATLPLKNYLNSGTIIGIAGAIKNMTEEVLSYPSIIGSDQRGYTRYYLNNKHLVGLDVYGIGFLTLYGMIETSYIDLPTGQFHMTSQNGKYSNGTSTLSPAVVHGNGGTRGGKEYYHNICSALDQRRKRLRQDDNEYNNNNNIHQQEKDNNIVIPAPPFTFANYFEEGYLFSTSEIIQHFRNYIMTNPTDVEAIVYLASKLASIDDFEEAQVYIDLALSLDRKDTEKLFNLYAA